MLFITDPNTAAAILRDKATKLLQAQTPVRFASTEIRNLKETPFCLYAELHITFASELEPNDLREIAILMHHCQVNEYLKPNRFRAMRETWWIGDGDDSYGARWIDGKLVVWVRAFAD